MSDEERRQRAEARSERAVIHKTRLASVERDLDPLSGPAAVALVKQLTDESWDLAGLPRPTYDRSHIPIRFVPGSRG